MNAFEYLHYLHNVREDVLNDRVDLPLPVVETKISDCERFAQRLLDLGLLKFEVVKCAGQCSEHDFDLRTYNKLDEV